MLWFNESIDKQILGLSKIARGKEDRLLLFMRQFFSEVSINKAAFKSNLLYTIFFSEKKSVNCSNVGCKARYCSNCFEELLGKCFVCHEPMDYNDLSDFSEEKGSSDEDNLKDLRVVSTKLKSVSKKHASKRKNKRSSKKTKKHKLIWWKKVNNNK